MKKYLILFSCTALVIGSLLVYMAVSDSSVPIVKTAQLRSQTVSDEITASGTVQAVYSSNVYLDMPVVVDKVEAAVGDTVYIGQTLFSVDTDATYAMLSSAGSAAGQYNELPPQYAEVFSQFASPGISNVDYSSIPKKITANGSGILTELNVSEGELAYGSVSICTISDLSRLEALISIDEKDIYSVKEGQTVSISGVGFGEKVYSGVVKKVHPSAKRQSTGLTNETVVDAVVSISDEDSDLKPGFNVTAVISVGEQKEAIIAPYECIRQDDSGNEYVYVYTAGSARRVDITTGEELVSGAVVLSGIKSGDNVIMNPDDIPSSGVRVKLYENSDQARQSNRV